ncbi:MAG TPA: PfkB family carbohydrate kinase [Dissulfurispiraceae bacterium]
MHASGLGQCSLDYLAVVDTYPQLDTKREVREWLEQGGGPVATALATLSRLGVSCRFYGITGDDSEGERIRKSLVDEGIDVSGLVARENASSQVAFIAIEKETAKRTIFWKRPTGSPLSAEELGPGFPGGSDFLILDGLMSDASLYAARAAREAGIPVMLDAGRMRPGMLEIARTADYVAGSEEFARDLGWGLSPDSLHAERKKLGAKVLTITLGARGSVTASDDGAFQTPAFEVRAVDTTGAGDVFHGAYIYGLMRKWGIRDTVIFASATAALKCTKLGGRTGIPRLDEVMEFLRERGLSHKPFTRA